MEYRTFIRKLRKLGDIPVPAGHARRRKGVTTYFFPKSAKPKILEFLTQNLGEASVATMYVQETLSFKGDVRALFNDMRLWIDGQLPTARNWSFGEVDDPWGLSLEANGGPLEIGTLRATLLKSDCPFNDTYDGHTPKSLTLVLEDGTQLIFNVIVYAWGDPDEDEPTRVTLVNGTTIDIDEITLYLKARLVENQ